MKGNSGLRPLDICADGTIDIAAKRLDICAEGAIDIRAERERA